MTPHRTDLRNLAEVTGLFLRLGATSFGGPAAHAALMEDEVVRRRRWMTRDEFLDLMGAMNLIPGPNSTEMAIAIGFRRAGWPGLIAAGLGFILPAFFIVLGFAWAYARYGHMPDVAGVLRGVKPIITVIVLRALVRLGGSALKSRDTFVLAAAAVLASSLGANELLVLLGAGLTAVVLRRASGVSKGTGTAAFPCLFATLPPSLGGGAAAGSAAGAVATVGSASAASAASIGLWPLFAFFLKVGSILYGSGYVLLAFLQSDLVDRWHWLTESQLLDAVAVGQFTPGPLFTTATFIGYLLAGTVGATVATLGIFLPSFLLVAVSGPLIPRIRRSAVAGAFLDGVNAASLALMAVVSWHLGRAAIVDVFGATLAVGTAMVLLRWRINTAWLVLAGAALGWASSALGGFGAADC